jgi:hypothetical protein
VATCVPLATLCMYPANNSLYAAVTFVLTSSALSCTFCYSTHSFGGSVGSHEPERPTKSSWAFDPLQDKDIAEQLYRKIGGWVGGWQYSAYKGRHTAVSTVSRLTSEGKSGAD